jgi:hypothetical protein
MLVKVTPAGMETAVGVVLSVAAKPFPSCPLKFPPEQYAAPVAASAHM